MNFILKSEIDSKNRYFCPNCNKTQIKKLDVGRLYSKYSCWNKECEKKDVPFVILNKYIELEDFFDPYCENCQEPYVREFQTDLEKVVLTFKCEGKLCGTYLDPFRYNLHLGKWEGTPPKITIYQDELIDEKQKERLNIKEKKEVKKEKKHQEGIIGQIQSTQTSIINESHRNLSGDKGNACNLCSIGDIPLLTMNSEQYEDFLEYHTNKVVVLVDVPNYVRTLHSLYPSEFDIILKKAYHFLLKFIDNSFNTSTDYIIRYYSKPDNDLKMWNQILIEFCRNNSDREFFHLLEIEKSGHYSDIDNYLIANGIEILERCNIKGFVIVSSDKDYLPVMQIASHKNIRKYIYGINTADIYEKYGISDIQLLGTLEFFKK